MVPRENPCHIDRNAPHTIDDKPDRMQISFDPQVLDQVFGRFLQALESSERAPRSEHRRHQDGLLRPLVRHAASTVPFYRDRLACLFGDDGQIDLSRWNEVPIVTRTEAPVHQEEMQSLSLPERFGPVSQISTSGSTGKPLRVSSNALNKVAANAALARTARWWGLDTTRALAAIVIHVHDDGTRYPEGRDGHGWCFDHQDSDFHELDMFTPVEQQIEWLLRKKPRYLSTQPSNATDLAHAVSPEQARDLGLKAVLAYSETVLPRVRELVAERFGAPLIAIYSCQEVGYIATQCPATSHYHIAAENVLVELLHDDGTPVAPGEAGQVVVTGFYNYAMPFIRYAIGDVATAGPEYCSCGLTLPVLAQVEGRTRHAFVFEDGARVWPRPITFDPSPYVGSRQYQMVQIDRRRIELRYVPDGTGRAPDLAGLGAYVREKIHPSANVVLVPMPAIPKGPGGKFTPFVSMVDPDRPGQPATAAIERT